MIDGSWRNSDFSSYYYPIKGNWTVAWVKMDENIPEDDWVAEYLILKAEESNMIYIPGGFASGLKAMEYGSKIIGFSGRNEKDIKRWNSEKWLNWNNI